jgi:hypothetical protein
MLEDEERLKNGRIALTTRKAHLSERNSKHKPCKLKFVQGDVVPIEFSSDPEASLSYEKLATKMAFLKEFGALLDEFNASNCFGLGMKNREISQSLATGEVLVETIDTGRTANVLSPANATSAESAVDTSWSFEHNNIIVFGHYLATTVCPCAHGVPALA